MDNKPLPVNILVDGRHDDYPGGRFVRAERVPASTRLPRTEASSGSATVANDPSEPQHGENEWVTYVE